jgi:prepilin-type N-terminal cleavage/methylation domain-containing protein
MSLDDRPAQRCADDRGFTLVELLVVMIVLGILAAIAVPTAVLQRRKAYETSAKADVKVITKEVLALYVDGSSAYTITGSDGTWELRSGTTVVTTGRLSKHNVVSANSYAAADGNYCLSVRNTEVGAQFWTADDVGMRSGDCTPTP